MPLDQQYDYFVERKYPLLRINQSIKKGVSEPYFAKHRMDEKTVHLVDSSRNFVSDRIKIILWMIDSMIKDQPQLLEKDTMSYHGYNTIQELKPRVLRIIDKAHSIKDEEIEDIESLLIRFDSFLGELT